MSWMKGINGMEPPEADLRQDGGLDGMAAILAKTLSFPLISVYLSRAGMCDMGANGGGLGGFGGDMHGFGGLVRGIWGSVWGWVLDWHEVAGSFGYLITRAANTSGILASEPSARGSNLQRRTCGRLPPKADSPEANLGAFRTMSGLHRCVWIIEWTGMGLGDGLDSGGWMVSG